MSEKTISRYCPFNGVTTVLVYFSILSDLRRECDNQEDDMIFRPVLIKLCKSDSALTLGMGKIKKMQESNGIPTMYRGQAAFYFSPFCPLL